MSGGVSGTHFEASKMARLELGFLAGDCLAPPQKALSYKLTSKELGESVAKK